MMAHLHNPFRGQEQTESADLFWVKRNECITDLHLLPARFYLLGLRKLDDLLGIRRPNKTEGFCGSD